MIEAEHLLADSVLRFGIVLPSMAESLSILTSDDLVSARHLLDLTWRESAARAAAYHFRQTGEVIDEYRISTISQTLHDAFIDGYVANLYTRDEIEKLIADGPFGGSDGHTEMLRHHGLFILPDRSGMSLIRLCQIRGERMNTLERGDDPGQVLEHGTRLAHGLATSETPDSGVSPMSIVLRALFDPDPEPVVRLGPSWNALRPTTALECRPPAAAVDHPAVPPAAGDDVADPSSRPDDGPGVDIRPDEIDALPKAQRPIHKAITALIARAGLRNEHCVLLPNIGDDAMISALPAHLRRIVALTDDPGRLHALQNRYDLESTRVTIRLESLADHACRRPGRYDLVLAAMRAGAGVDDESINAYLEDARRCLRPGGTAHVMLLLPSDAAPAMTKVMVAAEDLDIEIGEGLRTVVFTLGSTPAPMAVPPEPGS